MSLSLVSHIQPPIQSLTHLTGVFGCLPVLVQPPDWHSEITQREEACPRGALSLAGEAGESIPAWVVSAEMGAMQEWGAQGRT